jgi:hypothetical protein
MQQIIKQGVFEKAICVLLTGESLRVGEQDIRRFRGLCAPWETEHATGMTPSAAEQTATSKRGESRLTEKGRCGNLYVSSNGFPCEVWWFSEEEHTGGDVFPEPQWEKRLDDATIRRGRIVA